VTAVDLDINRAHAWSNRHGKVQYNAVLDGDFVAALLASNPTTILIEVPGPALHRGAGHSSAYGSIRWMIHAGMAAGWLWARLLQAGYQGPILAAPSTRWTRGYTEKVRHKLAGTLAPNHDLRECEAMIWFYIQDPTQWKPMHQYFKEL
jgi:hypothetical protein